MHLTEKLNTASPLLGFYSIFTFLFERCGSLYRFFVMHMSTLCRLTLFYLHESCFKFFLSSAFYAKCMMLLILWTDDSHILEAPHDSSCHYEYLYQCAFLEAFTILSAYQISHHYVSAQNLLAILLESMHNVLFMLLQWIFVFI